MGFIEERTLENYSSTTMKKSTGIKKKYYSLLHPNGVVKKPKKKSIVLWLNEQKEKKINASTGLEKIYNKYFSSTGCKLFVDLSVNEYSIADAILLSANTTTNIDSMVLVEFKKRYETSYKYFSAILEKEKYNNLISAGKLLGIKNILYLNEWSDGVITGWWLNDNPKNYDWTTQVCKKEDGSNQYFDKDITYLSFEKCDYVISKKTWDSISSSVLMNYLNEKWKD